MPKSHETQQNPQTSSSLTEVTIDQLNRLRRRLLQLDARNPLISFKHSERARTHIRLIDELPDVLFSKLRQGRSLQFVPLPPEDDNDLPDEHTYEFRQLYEDALQTDEKYRKGLEKLGDDPPSKKVKVLQRKLKDRLRVQQDLPERISLISMTLQEYAERRDINPNYELPEGTGTVEEEKHVDNELQTLFLQKDMEKKLGAIRDRTRTIMQETGNNTLYIAYGFLEWKEVEHSEKSHFAPLLLEPLEIERTLSRGHYKFIINGLGEEVEKNIALEERLKKDFEIALPELDEEDTPEKYLKKVSSLIEGRTGWRVRRYITIGVFSFQRLVMYKDINPDLWDDDLMENGTSICCLLAGNPENHTEHADVYEIDEIEHKAHQEKKEFPRIYTPADASQYSAVIDVTKGKSVAIQGPPGTGKSQTITNIIAASLAQGKRVLFLAEKIAALDVVKSRLEDMDLGHFCLALHSNKTSPKVVLHDIHDRFCLPVEYNDHERITRYRNELLSIKLELNRHAHILNLKFGKSDLSNKDILWKLLTLQNDDADIPETVKSINLDGVRSISKLVEDKAKNTLKTLEQVSNNVLANAPDYISHPFYAFKIKGLTRFEAEEIISHLKQLKEKIDNLLSEINKFNIDDNVKSKISLSMVEHLKNAALDVKSQEVKPDFSLITSLCDAGNPEQYDHLYNLLHKYQAEQARLNSHVDFVRADFSKLPAIRINKHCSTLPTDLEIDAFLEESNKALKDAESLAQLSTLLSDLFISMGINDEVDINMALAMDELIDLLKSTDSKILKGRSTLFYEKEVVDLINKHKSTAKNLLLEFNSLPDRIKSYKPISIDVLQNHLTVLQNSDLFSFFSSEFRKSRQFYKALSGEPYKKDKAIIDLKTLIKTTEKIKRFEQNEELNEALGDLFKGISTNFDQLSKAADFLTKVADIVSYDVKGWMKIRQFIVTAPRMQLDQIASTLINDELLSLLNSLKEFSTVTLSTLEDRFKTNAKYIDELQQVVSTLAIVNKQLRVKDLQDLIHDLINFTALGKEINEKSELLGVNSYAQLSEFPIFERSIDFYHKSIKPFSSEAISVLAILAPEHWKNLLEMLTQHEDVFSRAKKEIFIKWENLCNAGQLDELLLFPSSFQNSLIPALIIKLEYLISSQNELLTWAEFNLHTENARNLNLNVILDSYKEARKPFRSLSKAYELALNRSRAREILSVFSELRNFSGLIAEQKLKTFKELDKSLFQYERALLRSQLLEIPIPQGISSGRKSNYTEKALLLHEIGKRMRHIPLRQLFRRAGEAIHASKPCLMMSPLSVAQYIDRQEIFDILIIDESSQMRPEDAVGAIMRAKQVVVVGDPMQLPPTDFFRSSGLYEEEEDYEEEIRSESILDLSLSIFRPSRDLRWHYRSRDANLIAFSNKYFYGDRLNIFPTPVNNSHNSGVSSIRTQGVYKNRMNSLEAKKLIEHAQHFMTTPENKTRSLGIVAMNQQQRDFLVEEFDKLFAENRVAEAWRVNWEDTLEPFFVKNLENVQGDERDVIFISTVYGRDANGNMFQRFGPINSNVGHRRLNVLFTRAKEQVVVFTSMDSSDIRADETSNPGVLAFKNYLHYARTGNIALKWEESGREPDSEFEVMVADKLRQHGINVVPQVGVSGFYIDLAVKHPNTANGYLLGIECDGAAYHSSKVARDRDLLRQEILENLGWEIYRIWSLDWFNDPDQETSKLIEHIKTKISNLESISEVELEEFIEEEISLEETLEEEEEFLAGYEERAPESDAYVKIGNRVTYIDIKKPEEQCQVLIELGESKPEAGIISSRTPLSVALLDSEVGEEVVVTLPKGKQTIEILSIE